MTSHDFAASKCARARPLALTLALSSLLISSAGAATVAPHRTAPQKRAARQPTVQQTWTVLNCSDGASGSLRDIIEKPGNVQSGDIVDLSQLPALCGTVHSTISLTTGEITIHQADLTLLGPDASDGTVRISAGGSSRVFEHTGSGVLSIRGLTVADGYAHAAGDVYGGCIDGNTSGNGVYLYGSSVTNCHVLSDSGNARGGAIRAGDVSLVLSTVSDSRASAPATRGFGGGVQANNLSANYSSIRENVADAGQGGGSRGGGVYASSGLSIVASTIDHNRASYGGGLVSRATSIMFNSTLSDNVADISAAGWYVHAAPSLSIWNSTVAFNHSNAETSYGAVMLVGVDASSTLDLQSSIIANNTVGASETPNDVFVWPGLGVLTGSADLVMASNVSDPSVIVSTEDPKLGPLQFNGGPTSTRMLQTGSPALNLGNNSAGSPNDQRGQGYPRSTGMTTDIGAVQYDPIFRDGFD